MASAPTEIRTPVLALKGLRPGPLDDGGISPCNYSIGFPSPAYPIFPGIKITLDDGGVLLY